MTKTVTGAGARRYYRAKRKHDQKTPLPPRVAGQRTEALREAVRAQQQAKR